MDSILRRMPDYVRHITPQFALTDINPANLDMVRQVIETIVSVNKLPAKVTATTDRREAISGAPELSISKKSPLTPATAPAATDPPAPV